MSATQQVSLPGRILFVTEDEELVRRQIEGEQLAGVPEPLCDNISTDEITPGWVCFWYDDTLGRYCLVGLRNGSIERDSVRRGNFSVLVSGHSKGCGSSRETAPHSEKAAGIRLIIAKSFEKIYGQNCQNIGLLTSTDFGLIDRIRNGEPIPIGEFTRGLDPIGRAVVEHGGLFAYNRARLAGETCPPIPSSRPRPMTAVEKIIAAHAVVDAPRGRVGLPSVMPGDAVFCRADVRFTHDYVTAMAASLFREGFGADARVAGVERVYAFRDHLTFLGQVMPPEHKEKGLLRLADNLADEQLNFCEQQGIRLYGEHADGGSEAICHNAVLEDIALPGELVIGTDSHTCTAGAIGCFAFGVGSTDMANAWLTQDARVTVPKSVRIELTGVPSSETTAKDMMLLIMSDPYFKQGKAIGQVLEFCGPAITAMAIDERATLTNMAVEAGATTGFIETDELTAKELAAARGLPVGAVLKRAVRSDADAQYAHRMHVDLSSLRPMVATPGDPRNGLPIEALPERVKINIAYGGSCTGGKSTDIAMYARVLKAALDRGLKVHDDVALYIQFGSQKIKQRAIASGHVEIFKRAGARLIDPSCGACIKAGPGVSRCDTDVTVSAINRNFPGRSGPGQVYLASPLVVAASAIAGYITTPNHLLGPVAE